MRSHQWILSNLVLLLSTDFDIPKKHYTQWLLSNLEFLRPLNLNDLKKHLYQLSFRYEFQYEFHYDIHHVLFRVHLDISANLFENSALFFVYIILFFYFINTEPNYPNQNNYSYTYIKSYIDPIYYRVNY